LELLTSSKIGKVVNDLRKTFPDKEVQTLGKSLLKKWKKLLEAPTTENEKPGQDEDCTDSKPQSKEEVCKKRKAHFNIVNVPASCGTAVKRLKIKEMRKPDKLNDKEGSKASEGHSVEQRKGVGSDKEEESQSFSLSPSGCESDPIRMKCRELLLTAVKGDEQYPDGSLDPQLLVEQLEDNIFKELKDTGFKYKSRVRSRIANLRDPRNPDLRVMFLEGRISPAKLSKMTAEEMASNELKSLRAQFMKESIEDAQLSTVPGTKTDLLKCVKCRKRNCTYSQLQTRSADEPMTTFVLCNECGKRWKFN